MTLDELLQTVPAEVKAAIEQIEHKAGTSDADWQFIKAAGELLAAAKAASECPVELVALGDAEKDWWHCDVNVKCKSGEDADKLYHWLRDRMKDASQPAT